GGICDRSVQAAMKFAGMIEARLVVAAVTGDSPAAISAGNVINDAPPTRPASPPPTMPAPNRMAAEWNVMAAAAVSPLPACGERACPRPDRGSTREARRVRGPFDRNIRERPLTPTLSPQAGRGSER